MFGPCSNCRFWAELGDGDHGQCRRYAPHAFSAREGRALPIAFPVTTEDGWRGEFMPRPLPGRAR